MIKSIYIGDKEFKAYQAFEEDNSYIHNLSRINIFIGSNNSGKSRFTRTLFSIGELSYIDETIDIDLINTLVNDLRKEIKEFYNTYQINNDYGNLLPHTLGNIIPLKHLSKTLNFQEYIFNPFNRVQKIGSGHGLASNARLGHEGVAKKLNEIGSKYILRLETIIPDPNINLDLERIYIPILRGLRKIGYNADGRPNDVDVYLKRTKQDYFRDIIDIDKRIFTGLNLYNDTKRLLLGSRTDREKIKKFEEFLSKSFFNGKEINLIPRIDDDSIHVRIGDEEFPIFELGDGIQSLIILTYPLFFNQGKRMAIFLEEPEHCLHPGFQRIFIETLLKPEFDSYQYFITSHSNHLLDITLDVDKVSIYTFNKTDDSPDAPRFEIENVDNENAEILKLIGVRNSSVFLSNCTIWVEGITDRIYLRKYLEVYQKNNSQKFFEDTHFSFVEYGGGNITHWSFLENADTEYPNIVVTRLCGKLFLVTDKDGAGLTKMGEPDPSKKKKYERYIELQKTLGDRYYCLVSREIENTLSPEVLKNTIKIYERDKSEQLVFKNFSYEKYKDELLGNFINKNTANRDRNYAADSGTINDKVKFAKRAVKSIRTRDHLTPDALNLVSKIFEFIKENN